jgi:hypothetical protein
MMVGGAGCSGSSNSSSELSNKRKSLRTQLLSGSASASHSSATDSQVIVFEDDVQLTLNESNLKLIDYESK